MSKRYTLEEKQALFWSRVSRADGCWLWLGPLDGYGYGIFYSDLHYAERAHRTAYRYSLGPIPHGKVLLHSCDNPPCVNPAHLTPGTRAENNADRDRKGRHIALVGEAHGRARLTADQVRAIRRAPRERGVARDLAQRYGTTVAYIYALRSTARVWRGVA